MDDSTPVVILDHAEDVAALPPSAAEDTLEAHSLAYLRSRGISDPLTWAAFRLGHIDEATQGRLGLTNRRCSPRTGISIPTYDPRTPTTVVGVVRLTPAQNKHGFATPPLGIGCTTDIARARRVVLVDAPLLTLRLFEAGIHEVALVEDPAVLRPLLPWLGDRQIILVSHKKEGLRALRDGLGPLAGAATQIQLQGEIGLSSAESLAVLGLTREQFIATEPKPPIDSRTLHHLLTYAQGRLATPDGLAALEIVGAHQPELVSAYGLGYLPADFRSALDAPTRRMLTGLHCANSLVIPAFDRNGVVVDFFLRYAAATGSRTMGLHPDPQGMLAPVIATAFDEIIVTTSVWTLCHLWREGRRNVLLLRGAADASHNAECLRDNGVKLAQVVTAPHERSADIARILRGVGIQVQLLRWGEPAAEVVDNEGQPPAAPGDALTPFAVEPPPVPLTFPIANPAPMPEVVPGPPPDPPTFTIPALDLVEHDEVTGLATFKAASAVYVVEVPWDASSRLEVSLRHGGQVHRDRFDVAVKAQRGRFASSAALRTGIAIELIDPQLIALLDAVRALVAVREGIQHPALATILPSDRAAAMEMLTSPDLMVRIRADLSALGWIGEDDAKALLYLAATSRKLANPLWASLMASAGAGKSHGLDLIAELTPPEELVQVSRLTDAALYYQEGGGLSHKLMVIDEADALTEEVIVALRVLKTRGALSLSQADRSGPKGQVQTKTIEARGPVALLTSTAGKLEPQLLSRCVEVPVDESPEQTQRILTAQQRLHADPTWLTAGGRREAIVARHRTMQRLLATGPVVIPFAERIEFPATSVRHRREHERFLGLIEASALLHQHQRLKDRGSIVATEADFAVAARLVARQLAAAHQGLGQHARSLLDLLTSRGVAVATMEDLARLRPEWNRNTFRAALKELIALDYVTSPSGGRGKRREYRLVGLGMGNAAPTGVRLREVGELVKVGERRFTNLPPEASTG